MAALFGKGRNAGSERKTGSLLEQVTEGSPVTDGWRFSLKGRRASTTTFCASSRVIPERSSISARP